MELPAFARHRADYLDDDDFRALQNLLMKNPEVGDLIPDTGAYESCGSGTRGAAKANAVACE